MRTATLTAQPAYPAVINWGNPLTKGLIAVIDRGTVNPVSGKAYVLNNFYTYAGYFDYPHGRALSVDGTGGTNTCRLTLPTSGLSTQSFSIAGKIRTRTTAGAGVGIRAGTNNILLWRNSGWDTRVGGTDYTAAGTYNLNQVYDYALTSGASAVDLYVDGVSTIAGGAGGAGTLSDTDVFSDSSGGGAQYIDVWWLGVWNRKLTAQEVWQLKVNPWQIFKRPGRRVSLGFTAGGSTAINATLGEATANGLLATVVTATDIAATQGVATASGNLAAVSAETIILASLGTATADGSAASVVAETTITASCAVAIADGATATVAGSTGISASIGEAVADGGTATVIYGVVGGSVDAPSGGGGGGDWKSRWQHKRELRDFLDKVFSPEPPATPEKIVELLVQGKVAEKVTRNVPSQIREDFSSVLTHLEGRLRNLVSVREAKAYEKEVERLVAEAEEEVVVKSLLSDNIEGLLDSNTWELLCRFIHTNVLHAE